MIDSATFYARLAVCKTCQHWKGACVLGHALQGPLGCPERKFEGVNGVGYQEGKATETTPVGSCCGAATADPAPLKWNEVFRHLTESVAQWTAAGFPVVDDATYEKRVDTCKNCTKGQFLYYQCKHCRCLVYTKAKLKTETCPFGLWSA